MSHGEIDLQQEFYIRVRGQVHGPLTVERLHKMALNGRFARYHHVSEDGVTWHRASEYPELFPKTSGKRKSRKSTESPDDGEIQLAVAVDEPDEGLWYYARGQERSDTPVPFSQLKTMASAQVITEQDHVWTEGLPTWVPAASVAGLFERSDNGIGVDDTPRNRTRVRRSDSDRSESVMEDGRAPSTAVAGMILGITAITLALAGVVTVIFGLMLVTGLLLLFAFISAVLAVVFGHNASIHIRQSDFTLPGRGMAITALILGYSVGGVILLTGFVVGVLLLLGIGIFSHGVRQLSGLEHLPFVWVGGRSIV